MEAGPAVGAGPVSTGAEPPRMLRGAGRGGACERARAPGRWAAVQAPRPFVRCARVDARAALGLLAARGLQRRVVWSRTARPRGGLAAPRRALREVAASSAGLGSISSSFAQMHRQQTQRAVVTLLVRVFCLSSQVQPATYLPAARAAGPRVREAASMPCAEPEAPWEFSRFPAVPPAGLRFEAAGGSARWRGSRDRWNRMELAQSQANWHADERQRVAGRLFIRRCPWGRRGWPAVSPRRSLLAVLLQGRIQGALNR